MSRQSTIDREEGAIRTRHRPRTPSTTAGQATEIADGAIAAHLAESDPHTQYATDAAFNDHSARHENGGADEISVTGLSGVLADAQTPAAHAITSHTFPGGTTDFLREDGSFAVPGDNLLQYSSGVAAPIVQGPTTGTNLSIVVTLADAGLKVGDVVSVSALADGDAASTQSRVKLRFRDAAAATISDHNGNTITGTTEGLSRAEGITIPALTVDLLVGAERAGGSGNTTTRQHILKLQ